MLKLNNSFCRYPKFTCENLISFSQTHVKSFTHFSRTQQTCRVYNCVPTIWFATPFFDYRQQLRSYAYKKRFSAKKILKNSDVTKKSKQMSESLQPTLNHVSYGGQFEISNETGTSSSEQGRKSPENHWRKSSGESGSVKDEPRKSPHPIPVDFRVWEQVMTANEVNSGKSFKFKVLSYNVLAQYLLECHPYLYTDCHPYNLKWKVRASRLYDEIVKLAPDILCLQEVQASHLSSFYAKFEEIGYCGVFKQKTGQRHDGCAIYFKQSLFDLRDHVTVEYYQPEMPILNRDNIGIIMKLMPKGYTGPPIVVATTHLLYNPKRTDVRLAQMQVLLAEIDRFAFYNNGQECGYLPIILTGDFNSTPDSAVIQLLDRGHVGASPFRDTSDWRRIGVTDFCQHLSVMLNRPHGLNTDFSMTQIYNSQYRGPMLETGHQLSPLAEHYSGMFNSGIISHPLKLSSTYTKYKPDGCQEATTFQDLWVTVDYIYFSCCSNLRLLERLRLPTAEECGVLGKLPNDVYGSDHLALAVHFELNPLKSSV